jgi:hypothetical protein
MAKWLPDEDEILCLSGYLGTEEVNINLLTAEFFVLEISRCNAIIGLKVPQVITIPMCAMSWFPDSESIILTCYVIRAEIIF